MFYLGTHVPNWLWREDIRHPLFVSNRTIGKRKSFKRALVNWCLDSGGFSELSLHGTWTVQADAYIAQVRKYVEDVGRLDWAAPQDWMCEPHMLYKTGKSVEEHQRLTCENFAELRRLAPDLPFIPVLQGWHPEEYLRHLSMYEQYSFDMRRERIIGVGSVCRRAKVSGIADLFRGLAHRGYRLHGFGLKQDALRLFGNSLASSDSTAWSLAARIAGRSGIYSCGIKHPTTKNCANCIIWAQQWADKVAAIKEAA